MCERTGAGEMDMDGRMGQVDGDLTGTAPLKASVFSGCGLPDRCWVSCSRLQASAGLLSSASPPSPVLGCCVPSSLIFHGPSVYLLPTWV